jgi:hypothetical protein
MGREPQHGTIKEARQRKRLGTGDGCPCCCWAEVAVRGVGVWGDDFEAWLPWALEEEGDGAVV